MDENIASLRKIKRIIGLQKEENVLEYQEVNDFLQIWI